MEGSVSLWMVWGWFLVQGPPGAVLEVRADKFAERTSTSSLFGPISGSTENPTHPTNPKPTTQVAPKAALPRTNTLPDLKVNVRTLCVCNLLVGRCDINCCCDPDCSSSDLSTFSTCDVHIVTGDNELCRQDAAMYSTNSSEVVTLINPSLFCIETNNYKKGSSFFAPEVPNTSNFNSLMKQFGGFSFSTDKAPPTLSPTSASSSTSSSYQYGMPIKVRGGYLKLPAPLVTATCTDNNPAAFLIDQTTHCSRRIQKSTNCTSLPAFSINNYLNVKILPSPNANLNSGIPVFLSSIILKSLNGTLIRLKDFAVNNWLPNQDVNMCRNIVLEVEYIIVYNSKGTIVNASAALVLGTIESSLVPVQQRFQIKFIQENTVGVPFSGNPGYVVGLPLVAGFGPNATVGIIQSRNRFGQLTVMKSSANQDCLQMVGFRTPVLFGYNLNSGCIMRRVCSTNSGSTCAEMGSVSWRTQVTR
ncbi:tectonic-1-like isoform X3 [Mobula hypostoma]|uniref:tectonic-1-like isoform X3 n=1 Tax=Mobula hypostoma TaxID=723540 RepID=UPI002FC3A5C8